MNNKLIIFGVLIVLVLVFLIWWIVWDNNSCRNDSSLCKPVFCPEDVIIENSSFQTVYDNNGTSYLVTVNGHNLNSTNIENFNIFEDTVELGPIPLPSVEPSTGVVFNSCGSVATVLLFLDSPKDLSTVTVNYDSTSKTLVLTISTTS